MSSSRMYWLLWNVGSSATIILIITIILSIMLWRWDFVFYSLLSNLFDIHRHTIDVNHQIVQSNSEIPKSQRYLKNAARSIRRSWNRKRQVHTVSSENRIYTHSTTSESIQPSNKHQPADTVLNMSDSEETSSYRVDRNTYEYQSAREISSKQRVRSSNINNRKSLPKGKTAVTITENDPAHPKYRRVVLDVYGKYLPLRQKRNQCIVVMITSIVISAVVIAFFDGCMLASQSIYPRKDCPDYGDMECFHGPNYTSFTCYRGESIDFPLLSISATCYRWIIFDQSMTSILAQIGICAGLSSTFCVLVKLLIQILFYVYQQRRGVAAGMRRVLERTVGVNNITQPYYSCCIKCPFRIAPLNFSLYEHRLAFGLTIPFYLILPVLAFSAFFPLSYYQMSITSYTYIVLFGIGVLCLSSVVWIIWEVDEIRRVLPGGSISIGEIISKPVFKKIVNLVKSSIKDEGSNEPAERNSDNKSESSESSETSHTKKGMGNFVKKIYSDYISNNKSNKLNPETIEALQKLTNFSETDIQEWHAGFLEDCPEGELTREHFLTIFEKYYTKGRGAEAFCKYFFEMINEKEGENIRKHKNEINFAEFLVAIAPNTHGDIDSRLTLAFQMYDISEPFGKISKKEVIQWIKAMYDVADVSTPDLIKDYGDPEENASKIMKKFEENDDETLNLTEFIKGCKKHKKLARILLADFDNDPQKQS